MVLAPLITHCSCHNIAPSHHYKITMLHVDKLNSCYKNNANVDLIAIALFSVLQPSFPGAVRGHHDNGHQCEQCLVTTDCSAGWYAGETCPACSASHATIGTEPQQQLWNGELLAWMISSGAWRSWVFEHWTHWNDEEIFLNTGQLACVIETQFHCLHTGAMILV